MRLFRELFNALLLFALLPSFRAQAQPSGRASDETKIEVVGFRADPMDLTANIRGTTVIDQNGDKCALIKVRTTEKNFAFSCGMMVPRKVQPQNSVHPGEIWVYVPYGIKRLQIQHPRYGTVDYSIGISVEKACTYVLELVACGPGTVNQQWLVISVEPRDALVEIDGIPVDNVDGEAGKFLQFGKHTYSVSADGYRSVSGEVVVNDPYKKVETSVRLLSAYGFVEIGNAAETEGAYLYVDGKSMGTLPVPVQKLIGGPHELRIVKPRYLPFSRTVEVKEGETLVVNPALTPNFTRVVISSVPGAEIWVNGTRMGTSPWNGELEYGACHIECRKDGCEPSCHSFEFDSSSPTDIVVEEPRPVYGSISVSSNPGRAEVLLDGESVGETPLLVNNVLACGHTLTIRKEGFEDKSVPVNVRKGAVEETEVRLTALTGAALTAATRERMAAERKAERQSRRNAGADKFKSRGISHSIDVGYAYELAKGTINYTYSGIRDYGNLSPLELTYTFSYKFNPYFSLGVGTGVLFNARSITIENDSFAGTPSDFKERRLDVPIFLNMKAFILNTAVRPYFNVSAGWHILSSVFMMDAGIGCEFRPARSSGLHLLLGGSFVLWPKFSSGGAAQYRSIFAPGIKFGVDF